MSADRPFEINYCMFLRNIIKHDTNSDAAKRCPRFLKFLAASLDLGLLNQSTGTLGDAIKYNEEQPRHITDHQNLNREEAMGKKIRFLPAVLGFTVISLPGLLFAATGHVKFWVVGHSCTKEIASGASTLPIGQQCSSAGITISTASLDTDGTADSSQDAWRMPSTISITANQAISNLHLIFFREATQGPATTYFKTWVKGGVSNGSGTIKVIGSVKRLSPLATLTLAPVTASASNGSTFNQSTVSQWTNGSLTGPREVQVDLEIVSLSNGATLNLALGGGGYIKLRSQPTPDPAPPLVVCHDIANWFITTSCATIRRIGYTDDIIIPRFQGPEALVAYAYKFAQDNWDNLSQDMAQGQGEHLVSLATLLSVPDEKQPAFFELAQREYQASPPFGRETSKQFVESLYKTWLSQSRNG